MDYSHLIDNQFAGMTNEQFSKEDYQRVRHDLIISIQNSLTKEQKTMILSFSELKPVWIYGNWSKYPGIAWKLMNLERLKENNPKKFNLQIEKLKAIIL